MYSCGIVYLSADTRRGFFIASPEKALIDTLALRTPGLKPADIENHLFENLRIDEADFSRLDFSLIKAMLSDCARPSVRSFFVFLKRRLSL
jgi:hypothetical protein